MNFKSTRYRFASVHIGQNFFDFSPTLLLSLGCQLGLIILGWLTASLWLRFVPLVAAMGMNQSVWLHQPCPFLPASYPALLSSFLDATCLPLLLPPESPVTFSSLPVVFSVCLLFANPFPLLVLPTSLCRNSAFHCFIWAAVICHYFCKAIIKSILQALGESCGGDRMEIAQLGSVPTEPPSQAKTEKSHSGKLKIFLISPSVFQHIFKEPCLA